jgi:hypothetical protein
MFQVVIPFRQAVGGFDGRRKLNGDVAPRVCIKRKQEPKVTP